MRAGATPPLLFHFSLYNIRSHTGGLAVRFLRNLKSELSFQPDYRYTVLRYGIIECGADACYLEFLGLTVLFLT